MVLPPGNVSLKLIDTNRPLGDMEVDETRLPSNISTISILRVGVSVICTLSRESFSWGCASIFTAAASNGCAFEANTFTTTRALFNVPLSVASAEPAFEMLSVASDFVAFFSPLIYTSSILGDVTVSLALP